MKNYDNIIGEKYGRLTVKKFLYKNSRHVPIVECICDCGNIYVGSYYGLRSGNTKSCGCYRSEYVSNKNRSHGLTKCEIDRKSTRLNSSHSAKSRMPSSA